MYILCRVAEYRTPVAAPIKIYILCSDITYYIVILYKILYASNFIELFTVCRLMLARPAINSFRCMNALLKYYPKLLY